MLKQATYSTAVLNIYFVVYKRFNGFDFGESSKYRNTFKTLCYQCRKYKTSNSNFQLPSYNYNYLPTPSPLSIVRVQTEHQSGQIFTRIKINKMPHTIIKPLSLYLFPFAALYLKQNQLQRFLSGKLFTILTQWRIQGGFGGLSRTPLWLTHQYEKYRSERLLLLKSTFQAIYEPPLEPPFTESWIRPS